MHNIVLVFVFRVNNDYKNEKNVMKKFVQKNIVFCFGFCFCIKQFFLLFCKVLLTCNLDSTITQDLYVCWFLFAYHLQSVVHWFVFATVVIVVVLIVDLVAMVVGAGGLLDLTILKYFVLLQPNKSKSGPYTFNKSISNVSSICEKYL